MRTILLSLVCLICSTPLVAQRLQYKVIWKGDSSGYLTAIKSDSLGFEVYNVESKIGFWLFGQRVIATYFTNIYKDGRMIKSTSRMVRDGKLKEQTTTEWLKGRYVVVKDDKTMEEINAPITQSIAWLYFNRPETGSIYSERFGVPLEMETPDDHAYLISKPDGRINTYTFGSKYCKLVEVDNLLAKLYFIRIPFVQAKL